jgi:hypothetical protein
VSIDLNKSPATISNQQQFLIFHYQSIGRDLLPLQITELVSSEEVGKLLAIVGLNVNRLSAERPLQ